MTSSVKTPPAVQKPIPSRKGSVGTSAYMKRLQARRDYQELKTNVIFGLTFGWVLTLVGAFKTWILLEGNPSSVIFSMGLTFFAITLCAPNQMAYPRNVMKSIATVIGTNLFKAILSIVYFLTILPAGLIYQKKNNHEPFYAWTDVKPARIEGWTTKESSDERDDNSTYNLPGWLQPLQVVLYFVTHSQLLFLPCLLLLLMLGLIGVFVQSSALAPFIYTLF